MSGVAYGILAWLGAYCALIALAPSPQTSVAADELERTIAAFVAAVCVGVIVGLAA